MKRRICGVLLALAVVLSLAVMPTLTYAQDPQADYGDAPDNTLNATIKAYPGVAGRFPSLLSTINAGDQNNTGPYHLTVNQEWLSGNLTPSTTTEPDALLVDQDVDDAVIMIFYVEDPNTGERIYFLQIGAIHVAQGADDVTRYVNVLVDKNRDGSWGSGEHLVQDMGMLVPPGEYQLLQSRPFLLPNDLAVWVRVTLTRSPLTITDWDGSIQPGGLDYGETEDHLVTPMEFPYKPKEPLSNFNIAIWPANPVPTGRNWTPFGLIVTRVAATQPWLKPAGSFIVRRLYWVGRLTGSGPNVEVRPVHVFLVGRIDLPNNFNKISSIAPHCAPMPAPPLNIGLEARYPAGGSNRLERGYCLVALDPDGEYTAYDHDPFEVRFAETPQDGVGGIGEFPQIHERGSFAPDLSGEDHGLSASIIAGVIGGVTVLVSAAWYIRRRRRKAT